jgi:hypothetical protein
MTDAWDEAWMGAAARDGRGWKDKTSNHCWSVLGPLACPTSSSYGRPHFHHGDAAPLAADGIKVSPLPWFLLLTRALSTPTTLVS